ncbi:hypothetical protein [Paraburkholderia sacchari]|uniref:hypothetical protein n=1 Tax=Paraburkholderia sacchari TaxID=159450 RepID=UPI001BD17B23|nr:hypothetical protein [Paraburkholderia sacchari]
MPNVLVHVPVGALTTLTVNGRKYSATPGSPITVPDFDAQVLCANGWLLGGASLDQATGPTSGRPANPRKGQRYHDTTVGAEIFWDGGAWRHTQTGASS